MKVKKYPQRKVQFVCDDCYSGCWIFRSVVEGQISGIPFTITYSYQDETAIILDVFAGEYMPKERYMYQNPVAWYGYVKDDNILESSCYRIMKLDA